MLSELARERMAEHDLEVIVDLFEAESVAGEVAVAVGNGEDLDAGLRGRRVSPWFRTEEQLSAWLESEAFLTAMVRIDT